MLKLRSFAMSQYMDDGFAIFHMHSLSPQKSIILYYRFVAHLCRPAGQKQIYAQAEIAYSLHIAIEHAIHLATQHARSLAYIGCGMCSMFFSL